MRSDFMFYKRLADYRTRLNITQKDMALKLNTSFNYYSRLEAGISRPTPKIINNLVRMTKLDHNYWLDGITTHPPKYKFNNTEKMLDIILNSTFYTDVNELFTKENDMSQLMLRALKADIQAVLDLKLIDLKNQQAKECSNY